MITGGVETYGVVYGCMSGYSMGAACSVMKISRVVMELRLRSYVASCYIVPFKIIIGSFFML